MNEIEDGGPAFPGSEGVFGYGNQRPTALPGGEIAWEKVLPGMSLRDWFAGKALQGMLADTERIGGFEQFAVDAFGYADAMIKERNKP